MKLALIGYGKMGRMIEQLASERGHEVVARIDGKNNSLSDAAVEVQKADVCLEFTCPEAVQANVQRLAAWGMPMVIGTTGWESGRGAVRAVVEAAGVGCVYAANFSLGVQLFYRLVAEAARLMRAFPQFDVAGYEVHHKHKRDRPSGTAKRLSEILAAELQRYTPEQLAFSSQRCGEVVGEHQVRFDGGSDTLTLTHTARSRETFAEGALWAAEWVVDKKGFFSFEEAVIKG